MTPSNSTITDAELLARMFHEACERLAPQFSYTTRKASAVPWEDVPENNRKLMIATVSEVRESLTRTPLMTEPQLVAVVMREFGKIPSYRGPDDPCDDPVTQGYGNALTNVLAAIGADK